MKTKSTVIRFDSDGSAKCLWTEAIDLSAIGTLRIYRASKIEYNNARGLWQVTINGCMQPSFEASTRQACIDWEVTELNNALLKGKI